MNLPPINTFSLQECVCKPSWKLSSVWLRRNTSPSHSTSKWHCWLISVSISSLSWMKSAELFVTQMDLTSHQPHIHPSWVAPPQLVNFQIIEIIVSANSPAQNWDLIPRYVHVLQEERPTPESLQLIGTVIYFSFSYLCSSKSLLQAPILK